MAVIRNCEEDTLYDLSGELSIKGFAIFASDGCETGCKAVKKALSIYMTYP